MSNVLSVMDNKRVRRAKNQGGQYDSVDKCVQNVSEWC